MNKNYDLYSKRIVKKPWGYEYVVYNESDRLASNFLNIKNGHKTSLHCHPKKNWFYNIRWKSVSANWNI